MQLDDQFQKSVLNQLYTSKPYPTNEEKEDMANVLGMEYITVHNWFSKKRRKDRISTKARSTHISLGKIS